MVVRLGCGSVCFFFFFCVFFQAEDGIRDLVRSRGLGDVYKRQSVPHLGRVDDERQPCPVVASDVVVLDRLTHGELEAFEVILRQAVSYTHLTLPTSDLV